MSSREDCWRSLIGSEILATRITPPTISGIVARITTERLSEALRTRKILPIIITGVIRAVLSSIFMNI